MRFFGAVVLIMLCRLIGLPAWITAEVSASDYVIPPFRKREVNESYSTPVDGRTPSATALKCYSTNHLRILKSRLSCYSISEFG